MHELSLVLAVVRRAGEVLRENGGSPAASVTLEVGEASGVSPACVEACWPEAVRGTLLEGAALALETRPAAARCLDCGARFRPEAPPFRCPACGSLAFMLETGDDLVLKSIAVRQTE